MIQGMVITLEMKETEMGYRGSKSNLMFVKEQRIDGFQLWIYMFIFVRCILVAGKSGYREKLSNSILKIPQ